MDLRNVITEQQTKDEWGSAEESSGHCFCLGRYFYSLLEAMLWGFVLAIDK